MNAEHAQHTKHTRTISEHAKMDAQGGHYRLLLLMAALSFLCMYVLMYAMVNAFENVYHNVNQFYMAGLMASPMVIIEVLLMGAMYRHKKLNAAIIAASAIALIAFWLLIRQQTAVSDKQFLRSMIPHHAGALLMCDEASISDPDIKRLCESIRSSQQAEIDLMKAKLRELEAR